MRLTLLVTIDSVKPLQLLDILIHSLNLQTSRDFDVVFFNQTLHPESHLRAQLRCVPRFPHSYWTVPPSDFLGEHPMWDLYAFHSAMLDAGRIGDYLMSLHMEEFLDADYIEEVGRLLREHRFDILFGNLRRTELTIEQASSLLACGSPGDFQMVLVRLGAAASPHWSVPRKGSVSGRHSRPDAAFDPTPRGFHQFPEYADEDVYLMSRRFAETHNWFLKGHHLYFEDIHFCQQPGVCELGPILAALTRFPVYFNARRIYHLPHHKFLFQIEDRQFSDLLLQMETDDPVIRSLQFAVGEYRRGALSLPEALRYSRQNPRREGTQDMNYRYHVRYLPPDVVPHMTLTLAGIAWVVVTRPNNDTDHPRTSRLGILFGLLAATGQAVGLVLSKQGMSGDFSPFAGNVIRMLAATIVLWGVTLMQRQAGPTIQAVRVHPSALKLLAAGALVGPVLGVTASLLAVQHAPIGVASTLMALPPVFLLPLSYFIFKERFGWQTVIGTVVAIAGVALLFLV